MDIDSGPQIGMEAAIHVRKKNTVERGTGHGNTLLFIGVFRNSVCDKSVTDPERA